jgi:hypothetical protein
MAGAIRISEPTIEAGLLAAEGRSSGETLLRFSKPAKVLFGPLDWDQSPLLPVVASAG